MKSLRTGRRLRMKTAFWGEVQRVGQGSCRVLVEELSEHGLSFRCDQGISTRLMPGRQRAPGALFGVRVQMKFSLPGLQKPVEIPCRLVFCRRFSQDSYRFDCEFDPRENLQQQRVLGFLQRQQETSGSAEQRSGAA